MNLPKLADDIFATVLLGPNKNPSRKEIRRIADDAACGGCTFTELDTVADMVMSRLRDYLKK